ncbi:LptF/LptG family permease [Pseudotenacibaculum haliotis]|uniref:LptF/LptG family permease n=1 Tax=Pseudotenacibaculum haliotis TaxID=1862138 RepID=A0ABW5LU32_9FLAO
MRILDWYILKRYLVTFLFTLLILIPIAVAIDVSEKVDKFLAHSDLTAMQIIDQHYKNFIIYYANTFMPLALFIAVILFTSKLSNNTEIVAMTNAKISFTRFLYPYMIGATLVTIFALAMNHFVVPNSSKERKEFEKQYLTRKKYTDHLVQNFSLQLNDSTYIYLKSYNFKSSNGTYFTIENYKGIELVQKLTADNIRWNENDQKFRLTRYKLRKLYKEKDSIFTGVNLDTTFAFTPKDFLFKSALAQEMPSDELSEFIEISRKRGVKNLNAYLVELHKRTSLPISSYILTIIAVALAFKKKRGGIGVNLATGIAVMFVYVFFMKVAEVLGGVAGANSFIYVWIPNIVFGGLALYLYLNARK